MTADLVELRGSGSLALALLYLASTAAPDLYSASAAHAEDPLRPPGTLAVIE